jgi:hypothetical protein
MWTLSQVINQLDTMWTCIDKMDFGAHPLSYWLTDDDVRPLLSTAAQIIYPDPPDEYSQGLTIAIEKSDGFAPFLIQIG